MEIQNYINKKKEYYDITLNFLEDINDPSEEDQIIFEIKEELKDLCNLISKISSNHHHDSSFINKIEKNKKNPNSRIKNQIINNQSNKRILLFYFPV